MKTAIPISTILRRKGDWVVTIDHDATVFETIGRMVDNNVGAIVVTENGAPCGIFTERDYLRRIALEGRTSRTTKVHEVMTSDVLTVEPGATVEQCLHLMTDRRCRHLPVLRDGQLVGIISIGDCVREISSIAEGQVRELEHYIAGGYPG